MTSSREEPAGRTPAGSQNSPTRPHPITTLPITEEQRTAILAYHGYCAGEIATAYVRYLESGDVHFLGEWLSAWKAYFGRQPHIARFRRVCKARREYIASEAVMR